LQNRTIERFWSKIPDRPPNACWLWQGSIYQNGYGAFSLNGQNRPAHRVSYLINVGPIADGGVIDHLCRVTRCVNPDHLEAVSNRTNMLRGIAPAARAHAAGTCLKGLHDMTDVYVKSNGERQCRPCQIQAARNRRKRA